MDLCLGGLEAWKVSVRHIDIKIEMDRDIGVAIDVCIHRRRMMTNPGHPLAQRPQILGLVGLTNLK